MQRFVALFVAATVLAMLLVFMPVGTRLCASLVVTGALRAVSFGFTALWHWGR